MFLIYIVQAFILLQLSTGFPTNFGPYDVVGKVTDNGNARFFVIGDWGGLPFFPYDTPSEKSIADAMGRMGKKLNTSFQMALGDNFYFNGVVSVTDARFKETFEDVFKAESLQTPWYVLAGNHDHYGNASAQVEYTKRSQRWRFPDLFYTFTLWQSDGKTKLVDFVMIDTVILCGGGNISDWDDTPLQGPENPALAETSWQWIEDQLRQSNAPYLVVSGHFPVYSVAEHGPTQCLVDRLRPLLLQYKATTYLCGHDHNLQYLSEDASGSHIDYFVIGAGDIVEDSHKHESDVPPGVSKYFWGDGLLLGGFGLVEVNTTQMSISLVDHNEKTLHQQILKPRV